MRRSRGTRGAIERVLRGAIAAAMVTGAACGGTEETEVVDGGVDGVEVDARAEVGALRGSFEWTYYWVAAEADYAGTASVRLYTERCAVIATVRPGFAAAVDVEGTGRLTDGRLINVAGACGCARSPCWVEAGAAYPWGIGVQDRPLVPYRSLAVDRSVVPYGTRVWIEELDGVHVPGEAPWGDFVHDGCAQAVDTGGAIVGMHLDWFVGLRESYRTLDEALGLERVTVYDGGARCPDDQRGVPRSTE